MKNLLILAGLIILSWSCNLQEDDKPIKIWEDIDQTAKPWTRWWWMGSAVSKEGIIQELNQFEEAGIGGVEITPIYGVKGFEDQEKEYLSEEWVDLLSFTIVEAEKRGMAVDMPLGTGWPYGGPWIKPEDADGILRIVKYDEGLALEKGDSIISVVQYQEGKDQPIINLSFNALDKNFAENEEVFLAIYNVEKGRKVKRAAPGGAGYCVNPFSAMALDNHLEPFQEALFKNKNTSLRSVFNDSFEWAGNFTPEFFEQFQKQKQYDIRKYLNYLSGEGDKEMVMRISADYREVLSNLLLTEFTENLGKWSNKNGMQFKNQAHGSPGNLIDLYAASDIPETEIFRYSSFKIPGYDLADDLPVFEDKPDIMMMKFASSGANLAGRELVSSESCTWLREHFKVKLSHAKPEIDQLFLGGINHVFFHGSTYSPKEEQWPGWIFYASSHFSPTNTWWEHSKAFFEYIARCQSELQNSQADNDILLYWPLQDVWHSYDKKLVPDFTVHHLDDWLVNYPVYKLGKSLMEKGYTFDYISDDFLNKIKVENGRPAVSGLEYKAIVVPECKYIPIQTMEHLRRLSEQGVTIIFQNNLPEDVPGFYDLKEHRKQLKQIKKGTHQWRVSDNVMESLNKAEIIPEELAQHQIQFIRKKWEGGWLYFLSNLGEEPLNENITLSVPAEEVVLMNPMNGNYGRARWELVGNDKTLVKLQLEPGESIFIKAFDEKITGISDWRYLGETNQEIALDNDWKVHFLKGGPTLPTDTVINELVSWTEFLSGEDKYFSGTASYSTKFSLAEESENALLLKMPGLHESAKVSINGHVLGHVFSIPYQIVIPAAYLEKENQLEIEVSNLMANRIKYMEEQKIEWRKFYDINFASITYTKFDPSEWELFPSGLTGKVTFTTLLDE